MYSTTWKERGKIDRLDLVTEAGKTLENGTVLVCLRVAVAEEGTEEDAAEEGEGVDSDGEAHSRSVEGSLVVLEDDSADDTTNTTECNNQSTCVGSA